MVRWKPSGRSRWLEDRRGMGGRGGVGGGGGLGGLPFVLLSRLGLPGIVIALVLMFVLGGNPFGGGSGVPGIDIGSRSGNPAGRSQAGQAPPVTQESQYVNFLTDHIQRMWIERFAQADVAYEPARVVLFEQATATGCGTGSAATGPFYCPLDDSIYLDLGFFRELRSRFQAPGDFAQAYVMAHEFGHHVQNVLGISDQVRELQRQDPDQANRLSVRLELQADCLAGVWGHTARTEGILEPGDLEEGLRAAAAIGDDRIQERTSGRIDPERWTHGSSDQRVEWFQRGFQQGDPNECDTFAG